MKISGVYCFTNTRNGKKYVGSAAASVHGRKTNHLAMLRNNVHHSIHFQRAWNKYGEAAFKWRIIEQCAPECCVTREQFWIDKLKSANPKYGYNRNPKASSSLGVKRSDETKAKIAAANRGRKASPETRAKMSANSWQKGRPMSEKCRAALNTPEVRKRMAEASRGRKFTPEQRAAISVRMVGNTNSSGRVLTEIHKARISAALKGKPGREWTEEEKAKLIATQARKKAEARHGS